MRGLIATPEAEKIAGGFQFVEGPVWLPTGNPLTSLTGAGNECLVFSDIPASLMYWYRDGRTGIFRESTGQANGNTLDIDGSLLSCEHQNRRVSKTDDGKSVDTVAERFRGRRLNSPNDVVVRSDGMIFFTDPPYGVSADRRELDFQGVYCVDRRDGRLRLICDSFEKPNGLAFSLDEREMYVADTERGHLMRYRVDTNGGFSREKVFCECDRPDGMRLDQAGNIWVACLRGLEVYDPIGRHITSVDLPERPANLVFGDADLKSVYICARTSIYRIRSKVAGAVRATLKQQGH